MNQNHFWNSIYVYFDKFFLTNWGTVKSLKYLRNSLQGEMKIVKSQMLKK